MPNSSGDGFVDYVLYAENGKPIAVLEAKCTSIDPKRGKIQAKLYADGLEKAYGVRPLIFLATDLKRGFGMTRNIQSGLSLASSPKKNLIGIITAKPTKPQFMR